MTYARTWPSTGQCMTVRLTRTLFHRHHHHRRLLQSAVQVILYLWICLHAWLCFLHDCCTSIRNLSPLLLILSPQLDVCAACLKQKYFQCYRPCRIQSGYHWAVTTELSELLSGILFHDYLVRNGLYCKSENLDFLPQWISYSIRCSFIASSCDNIIVDLQIFGWPAGIRKYLCTKITNLKHCRYKNFTIYGWVEFVCELLVLSGTFTHAETNVALFRITVCEGFVSESSSVLLYALILCSSLQTVCSKK